MPRTAKAAATAAAEDLEQQLVTDADLDALDVPRFDDEPSREEKLTELDARGDALNGVSSESVDDGPSDRAQQVEVYDGYGQGSFEISADVKAVRGKNTNDGPSLEIVLDASIDSHVADIMSLIGRSFTRIIFRPYREKPWTPEPTPLEKAIAEADDDDASDEEGEAEE